MHAAATPKAPVEMLNAPLTPRRLIERKTLTTSTFNGIPNKFIMTERCESGTYLLLSVPMDGKYIPTHASKAKKPATNVQSGVDADEAANVAPPMARAATESIPDVDFSVGNPILANCPKRVDPKRQHAMKHENTVPYGVVAPDPKYWVIAPLMAGGHCSTKIYMAASNKDCAAPTNIIFGSALMTLTASAIVGLDVPLAFPAEFSFHKKAAKCIVNQRVSVLYSPSSTAIVYAIVTT